MTGHCHNRTGSIIHQNIVSNPDRDLFSGCRVRTETTRECTSLRFVGFLPCNQITFPRFFPVLGNRVAVLVICHLIYQRVLGREHHISGAKNCIWPSSVDLNVVSRVTVIRVDNRKVESCTFASPYPVTLGLQGGFRPINEAKIIEQALCVVRDLKEPLLDLSLFDRGSTALAGACDNLFIREHSHT